MEIKKIAVCGTLESSDCMVTVEPGTKGIEFELESAVIRQYGKQITKVTYETLDHLGVTSAKVRMVDKGALDCTIKARVEGAVFRASEHKGKIDWGGAVR